jgi:hypothetical protein
MPFPGIWESAAINRPWSLSFRVLKRKGLFIEIPEQMKWLQAHIGALNSALQQAPEVLNAVGVDVPFEIGFSVVNDLMG